MMLRIDGKLALFWDGLMLNWPMQDEADHGEIGQDDGE